VDRDDLAEGSDPDAPLRARLLGDLVPDEAPDARKLSAALRAGARVALDLPLQALPGADVTYRLRAPEGLAIASASAGDLAADGQGLALRLDNSEGDELLSRTLRVVLHEPASPAPVAEDVRARLDLTLGAFGLDGVPVALGAALDVRALDVTARFPGALPGNVTLPFVGADGLRALHAADALTEADLAAAEEGILDALRADLAASLPGAFLSGGLEREDLREDAPPGTPLRFHATARGRAPAEPDAMRQAQLALALGATLALDVPLPPAPVAGATYVLHPPPGMTLVGGASEGPLPPEGGHARLLLRRADLPAVRETDAEVSVQVDVRGFEVDSGRILSGGDPRMVMHVDATAILRAVEIPPGLRATLDPRVELTHLTADGLRRLRQEGLLPDKDLDRMREELVQEAKAALRSALGADAQVEGAFVEATLAPDALGPVLFTLHATARPRVDGAPPDATAAIALGSAARTFTLPRLEGLDTEYAILLPPGIEVGGVETDGGDATLRRLGGRDVLVLRPGGESMTASATMTVTSSYVLASHGTEVFALLLVLALLVEAPVAFILLRRAARQARVQVQGETAGPSQEDGAG
jgi:hypothetical protein